MEIIICFNQVYLRKFPYEHCIAIEQTTILEYSFKTIAV